MASQSFRMIKLYFTLCTRVQLLSMVSWKMFVDMSSLLEWLVALPTKALRLYPEKISFWVSGFDSASCCVDVCFGTAAIFLVCDWVLKSLWKLILWISTSSQSKWGPSLVSSFPCPSPSSHPPPLAPPTHSPYRPSPLPSTPPCQPPPPLRRPPFRLLPRAAYHYQEEDIFLRVSPS